MIVKTGLRLLPMTMTILAGATAMSAAPASAQVQGKQFDIPAQSLSSAILEFSRQSDMLVVVAPERTVGKRSRAVRGRLPIGKALADLLRGTGLHVYANPGGGYRIDRATGANATSSNTSTSDATAAIAARDGTSLDQDIVVTATKRDQRLIDVPIAITALNSEKLQRLNADRFEDYVRTVPGLVYNQSGANSGTFVMRGVATSSLAGNTQSPVAVYIDDLPTLETFGALVTPDLRLVDIERVEVLRGPQGTLFGAGAEAGALRIITNKPDLSHFSGRAAGSIQTTQGGDPSFGADLVLNVPLSTDTLGVRLVGYGRRDGGYVDNVARRQNDVNSQTTYGGRAMLKWQASPDFSLLGTISYQKDEPDDSNFVDYNGTGYTYSPAVRQPISADSATYNLVGELKLPWAIVTSSTTYNERHQSVTRDYTLALAAFLARFGYNGSPYSVVARGPSDTFTQEVRLASRGSGPFQWLIGGFYLNNHRIDDEQIYSPGAGAVLGAIGYSSDYLFTTYAPIDSVEIAGFGEVSYTLGPLTATAGLRVFRDVIKISSASTGIVNGGNSSVSRRTAYMSSTPKFALSLQLARNTAIYAQAARGYRVGQNNLSPANDPVSGLPIPGFFDPDHLWNYELGVKGRWLDGAVTANAAVFHIDFSNIQLQAQSAGRRNYIANAGNAKIDGGELELTLSPTRGFEAGFSMAYNDARLVTVATNVNARVGDRLPGSPKFTSSEYLQYSFRTGVGKTFVRAEHQYFGKAFSNLNNATSLVYGDYDLVNARVGFDSNTWGASVFATNLADIDSKANAFSLPAGNVALRVKPRTIGLSVYRNF